MIKNEIQSCPKCGNQKIIRDLEIGEEICNNCGLVISDAIIDSGPEWRAFSSDEKNQRSRTGVRLSPTLFDMGLSTRFTTNRDASGKLLNYKTVDKMNRLQKYDNRSKVNDSQTRNLSIALPQLDRIAAILHLPESARDYASRLYRKALSQDMIRGRSIDSFVAACIYATCRLQGIPRPLKSISAISTRDHSEVARTYRLLIKELKIKMPLDDSFKFVSGISSKLKLKRNTELRAIEILNKAKEKQGLTGKEPRGIAAAALYMACLEKKERRTQKQVAQAAGTTEVTLRNRMRGLESVIKDRTTIDPITTEQYIVQ
ncbi:transcription initiation factor IIB [Candidatus Bathyarchaeota archaeon]|nr:transcription initiation factor IIB [Candidatus Bathyarchaeota archaeon]